MCAPIFNTRGSCLNDIYTAIADLQQHVARITSSQQVNPKRNTIGDQYYVSALNDYAADNPGLVGSDELETQFVTHLFTLVSINSTVPIDLLRSATLSLEGAHATDIMRTIGIELQQLNHELNAPKTNQNLAYKRFCDSVIIKLVHFMELEQAGSSDYDGKVDANVPNDDILNKKDLFNESIEHLLNIDYVNARRNIPNRFYSLRFQSELDFMIANSLYTALSNCLYNSDLYADAITKLKHIYSNSEFQYQFIALHQLLQDKIYSSEPRENYQFALRLSGAISDVVFEYRSDLPGLTKYLKTLAHSISNVQSSEVNFITFSDYLARSIC